MKRLSLFASVVILAAACASAAPPETSEDSPSAPSTEQADGGTGTPDTSASTGSPDASGESQGSSAQTPEGPVAPDFTMALADGGSFTLYDEQKPVYMIFWAEW